MKKKNSIYCIDEKGHFKLPLGMFISFVFMSRYCLYLIMAGLSTFLLGRRHLDFELPLLPPALSLITSILFVIMIILVYRAWKNTDPAEKARPVLNKIRPTFNAVGLIQCILLIYYGTTDPVIFIGLVDLILLLVTLLYINFSKTATEYFSILNEEAKHCPITVKPSKNVRKKYGEYLR